MPSRPGPDKGSAPMEAGWSPASSRDRLEIDRALVATSCLGATSRRIAGVAALGAVGPAVSFAPIVAILGQPGRARNRTLSMVRNSRHLHHGRPLKRLRFLMRTSEAEASHDLWLCPRFDRLPRPRQSGCPDQGRRVWGDLPREDDRHHADRPKLKKLIAKLAAGDVVIIPAVDRLSRDTTYRRVIARDMQRAGAGLRSLAEPVVDTTSVFAGAGACHAWRCRQVGATQDDRQHRARAG